MKNTTLKTLFLALLLALVFTGCDSQEEVPQQPFVAAFESQSHKYEDIIHSRVMRLVFSEKARANGTVKVRMVLTAASHGVDFNVEPSPSGDVFELPIYEGQTGTQFLFQNLIYPFDNSDKMVKFEIIAVDYPYDYAIQGYTNTVISFGRSQGAMITPNTGGPNQGNQVYFDLSTGTATEVWRESWDLGFYCGDEFRVGLNSSIYMAAKELGETDIDAISQADVAAFQSEVAIGTFDPENINYIDSPIGLITGTAIAPVSAVMEENKVYLINLGYTVGTAIPTLGSVGVAGSHRGWKKIRVLRDGENYKLQYASLNSITHEEIVIQKNSGYNFTFFSFNTQTVVNVEPEKTKWDLNFTVFTNLIDDAGSYGYSDFVLNNIKAGVKAYQANATTSLYYDNYTLSDVTENAFVTDQRVVGADWRDVFSGTVYPNKFYILKDLDGNYYKMRMLDFLDEIGTRGYPKFEYKLLQ